MSDEGNLSYKKLSELYAKLNLDDEAKRLTYFMNDKVYAGMKLEPTYLNGEMASMDIVPSEYVDPQVVYAIPTPRMSGGLIPYNRLDGLSLIGDQLSELFMPSVLLGKSFGRAADSLVEFSYAFKWEREDGETLMVWAFRLDERGLLDDPEIRRAYQKAVFVGMWKWFRDMIAKTSTLMESKS